MAIEVLCKSKSSRNRHFKKNRTTHDSWLFIFVTIYSLLILYVKTNSRDNIIVFVCLLTQYL